MAAVKGGAMPATPVTEQSITEALRRLPPERWPQVLAFIDALRSEGAPATPAPPPKRWTATELRKLPAAEREAILAHQAALLEDEYRNNPELTAFEAFGDEDLYVDSSDTETR
jgi:hypothetical protein